MVQIKQEKCLVRCKCGTIRPIALCLCHRHLSGPEAKGTVLENVAELLHVIVSLLRDVSAVTCEAACPTQTPGRGLHGGPDGGHLPQASKGDAMQEAGVFRNLPSSALGEGPGGFFEFRLAVLGLLETVKGTSLLLPFGVRAGSQADFSLWCWGGIGPLGKRSAPWSPRSGPLPQRTSSRSS